MLRLLTVLFAFLALNLSSAQGQVAEGPGISGGGDALVAEFMTLARRLVADLPATFPMLEQLKASIASARVESTDESILIDGLEKDAANFPRAGRIKFNRSRWSMISDVSLKKLLVLHEYLGLIGADDQKYQISGRLVRDVDSLGFTPVPAGPSQCVEAIAKAGCNIDFGDRARICLGAMSGYAVEAVEVAMRATNCNLEDSTLRHLVSMTSPRHLNCVKANTKAGCNIDFGSRAELCLQARSRFAVRALGESLRQNQCNIDDSTYRNLIMIRNEVQSSAVSAINRASCNVDFGSRSEIALQFRSMTGVRALEQTANSTQCNFSDSTMRSLSKM